MSRAITRSIHCNVLLASYQFKAGKQLFLGGYILFCPRVSVKKVMRLDAFIYENSS